jgi:hypothetical protein
MHTVFAPYATAVAAFLLALPHAAAQGDTGRPLPGGPARAVSVEEHAGARPDLERVAKMELSERVYDFGQVWQGQPAQREFTIKNIGDAPLTISLRSSCGCTVATKPKSPLPPGEQDTFSITYDTKLLGKAHKRVTLTSNDPAQPEVVINVKGEVQPLYECDPPGGIQFQALDADSVETYSARLVNKFGRPVRLQLKETDLKHFTASLEEITPGMEYRLTATTQPPLRKGRSFARAELTTDLEAVPLVEVRLSATVEPRVVVTPTRLYIPPSATKPSQHPIRMQYRLDKPVHITEAQVDADWLKFELLPDEEPTPGSPIAFHQVMLTVPPFSEIPPTGGKLVLLTDDADPQFQAITVEIVPRDLPANRGGANETGSSGAAQFEPVAGSKSRDASAAEARKRR